MKTLLLLAIISLLSSAVLAEGFTPETSAIKAFRTWIQEKGGFIHPSASFLEKDGRRGMFSVDNIQPGEALLKVPVDLVITPYSLNQTFPELARVMDVYPDSHLWLSMYVLMCKYDSQCPHKAWVDALPDYASNYCVFEQEEIDALAFDPSLQTPALNSRAIMERAFLAVEELGKNHTGLLPKDFNFDSFRWAVSMVISRAWVSNTTVVILPGLDLINFGYTCPGQVRSDQYVLSSVSQYKAGDEILCAHGRPNTVNQLLEHGVYDNKCSLYYSFRPNFTNEDWKTRLSLEGFETLEESDGVSLLLSQQLNRKDLALMVYHMLGLNLTTSEFVDKVIPNDSLLARHLDKIQSQLTSVLTNLGLAEEDQAGLSKVQHDKRAMQMIMRYKATNRQCLYDALARLKEIASTFSSNN